MTPDLVGNDTSGDAGDLIRGNDDPGRDQRRPGEDRFDRTRAKTERARHLRRAATRSEYKLWFYLRGAQIAGRSFRRQHPVGPYILDFYCASAKLAVELDGEQHFTVHGREHDEARSFYLATKGIAVVRFPNHDVHDNLDGVLMSIERALQGRS